MKSVVQLLPLLLMLALLGFLLFSWACARPAPTPTPPAQRVLQWEDIAGLRCVYWSDKSSPPACVRL